VKLLGGPETAGVGFALGMERLVLLHQQSDAAKVDYSSLDIYLIAVGEQAQKQSYLIAEQIRNEVEQVSVIAHCGADSFKSQFKKADKSGARIALILGDDEMAQQNISVKYLREELPQENISQVDLIKYLQQLRRSK
ncbi:MAG: His/Gly/Thr/Pro-type tRNA ligase C-terminal domain-containing protein, partial [Gammaproteobacteria bacterium]